jgi:hypothetical protein
MSTFGAPAGAVTGVGKPAFDSLYVGPIWPANGASGFGSVSGVEAPGAVWACSVPVAAQMAIAAATRRIALRGLVFDDIRFLRTWNS